ncbi:MAG TPA: TolC family protein [Syntrophorhabdaceae bacterium]|nr:TolC family protein [Syntrophorhabdaceae bacterium]HQM80713.1 TolC family protein [Syntrophorhabdaceae bacterium]
MKLRAGVVLVVFIVVLQAFSSGVRGQGTVPPEAESLMLDQAISLALQNNNEVKNALLETEKAREQVAAFRTRRLPIFTLSILGARMLKSATFEFPRGSLGTFAATGPIPAKDTDVEAKPQFVTYGSASMAQPLSQQYRIGLNIDLLETNQAIAMEKLRLQRQTTVNDVKHAYYGVLQLQSSLEAAQEAVVFYRELTRVVDQHVAQKAAMRSEGMEVKARLAKAEKDVLALSNAMASQKEQLNRLLARDIRTRFTVSPVPDPSSFVINLDEAGSIALSKRPEVKEARLKVKKAEYNMRIKKSEYIPDVSLAVNYVSVYNVEVLPRDIATAGLLFTWDIFDWGRKKRELAERSMTIEQASNGVRETESVVLMDVNAKYRKLQEAKAESDASQLGLEAAREKLRTTKNQYAEKTLLLKDVLEAEAALAEANRQYQNALLDLWKAKANFEKAMGEEYK